MKTTEFIEKLPRAVNLATQHILEINKEDNKDKEENDTEYEYEATLRAQIYHNLLNAGVPFMDLTLDPKPNLNGSLGKKHIDLWFTQDGIKHVLIEIKMINELKKSSGEFLKGDLRTGSNGKESGIVPDILKLDKACWKLRKKVKAEGIMIVSYPRSTDRGLDLRKMENSIANMVRKRIRSQISLLLSVPERKHQLKKLR
jgi:hypothetical protein